MKQLSALAITFLLGTTIVCESKAEDHKISSNDFYKIGMNSPRKESLPQGYIGDGKYVQGYDENGYMIMEKNGKIRVCDPLSNQGC